MTGLMRQVEPQSGRAIGQEGQGPRRALIATLVGLVLAAMQLATGVAWAGTYDIQVCADPATGQGNLGAGQSPDGWSFQSFATFWTASASCSGSITASKGIRVHASNPGGMVGQPAVGARATLSVAGLPGLRIVGAELYRMGVGWGGNYDSPFGRLGEDSGVLETISSTVGDDSTPFSAGNLKTVAGIDSDRLYIENGCGPGNSHNCGESVNSTLNGVRYIIFGGTVTLSDASSPSVDTPTLVPLLPTQSINFHATDQGGGLTEAALEVDGEIVETKPLSAANANCQQPYKKRVPCDLQGSTSFTHTFSGGTHTVRLRGTDVAGNHGFSAPVSLTVAEVPPVEPAPVECGTGSTCPSAQCSSLPEVFEGTVGPLFLRVRAHVEDERHVWVCFRASDTTTGLGFGGRVVVTTPAASIGTPNNDSNYLACETTPGNQVPGSHPLVGASILGTPIRLDTYANGGAIVDGDAVWICAKGGAEEHRVVVPIPGIAPGGVGFDPDPGTPGP